MSKQSLKESIKAIFHKFGVDPAKHGIKLEEIKLEAQATLQDGTVIYSTASEWAIGVDAFSMDEEGNPIPLPVGEYVLEDGTKVMVGEDGLVAEIVPSEAEPETETEMSNEQMLAIIENLTSRMSVVEARNTELNEKLITESQKLQAANAQVNTLKTELSEIRKKPATNSIKDRAAASKTTVVLNEEKSFHQMTLGERIKSNISKINN